MLDVLRDPDAALALGTWTYAVVAVAVAIDSLLPLLPAELLVVAAGASAATGRLDLRVLAPAVALGGLVGDVVTYHVGRSGSRAARRALARTPRRRRALARLERSLGRRRTATIVAARFVPGGRTGIGLLAGLTRQPRRHFLGAAALAVALWTVTMLALGHLAGRAAGGGWASLAIAAAALAVTSLATLLGGRRRGAVTSARIEADDERLAA